MKVVVLAGGLGTRLSEETGLRPKPMVDIGGHPILWHILKGYAQYGLTDFVIALGYKSEHIKDYFLSYNQTNADLLLIDTGTGKVLEQTPPADDWRVRLVETGEFTQTGGRVRRLRSWLDEGTFCLTYGDGVSDVNIDALLAFHSSHGKLATVTAVRPASRFGGLVMKGHAVSDFTEKSQLGEGWINGGFMALEPEVLDIIEDDQSSLEKDLLEELASRGELMAFRHEGYWQSMDTLKEARALRSLWEAGSAPWKTWD